ncbi:2'-5' RNA ligase family protein [Georgenia thermotolerans]|uniref:RNA 2',3'-cyclic phosphodiesterase n=1 Tax=Georgenia thermotolerans TaxID=527326 RepID=A0A7J5UNZ3_9MICO|nr:2'-5' RNA ligase family protein [Georgenia thermotolerans]KAE8763961.1 RNA 2',3'-cyclic phosphodiesterase [Georgenia thermotolerans]
MRLFVALALPDDVQRHLDLATGALLGEDERAGPHPLRWVPIEQRHITLAFYGEVPEGAVPALRGELAQALAGFAPLRLQLRGAGVFSRRTLWIGVQQQRADGAAQPGPSRGEADGLVTLMSACEDVGERFARVERRDRHRAHVTLARLSARRPEADELAGRAHALSVYAGPPWTATDVDLVSSRPGAGRSGGPLYEVVDRFRLGGG